MAKLCSSLQRRPLSRPQKQQQQAQGDTQPTRVLLLSQVLLETQL